MKDTTHTHTGCEPNTTGRRNRPHVRVGEKELKRLRARARRAGMGVSANVRMKALSDGKSRPLVDIDADELRKAFANLKHAGSNLNQCSRVLNTYGADEGSIKRALSAIGRASEATDKISAALTMARS